MTVVVKGDRLAIERPDYYVRTGAMFENPHGVSKDEALRMCVELTPEVAAQVVFGKYVESSGLVFAGDRIQQLFNRDQDVILGSRWFDRDVAQQSRLWYETKGYWTQRFHTGVDLARQTDYTVIFTIDTLEMPARVVAYRRLNRVPWPTIYGQIGWHVHTFGTNVLVDSTGIGDVVLNELEGMFYCAKHSKTNPYGHVCQRDGQPVGGCRVDEYTPLGGCEGFHFSGPSKKELVEHLRTVLDAHYDHRNPEGPFGNLRCPPIPQLEEELTFYAWDDKKLQTDCLFALALAAWSGLEDPCGEYAIGSAYAGGG